MDIAANNLLRQPCLRLCIWACRSKRAVAGHSVGGHWSIPRRRALSRRGSIRLRVWPSSTRVDRKLIQAVCDCTWTEWFGTRGLWRFLSRARSPSHQHCNIFAWQTGCDLGLHADLRCTAAPNLPGRAFIETNGPLFLSPRCCNSVSPDPTFVLIVACGRRRNGNDLGAHVAGFVKTGRFSSASEG